MREVKIVEYLEMRFTAGRTATYDPAQIAALCGQDVTPAAIERAIQAIDSVRPQRRPVDPWMVNGVIVLLCAILGGCAADLPTAPTPASSQAPAPAPTPTPTGPPFFSVTLTGESPAYTDHWGLSISVTPNRDVVSPPPPARIVIDCGTGTPTTVPGFVGQSGYTCVFGTAGDYTVRVSAVAPDGWTTTSTMRVSAAARPGAPSPSVPTYLYLDAQEVAHSNDYAEWRFSAVTTGTVTMWDFGDGTGVTNNRVTEQHVYRTAGDYLVTVKARQPGGGADMSATRAITITLCAKVDCP